MPNPAKSSHYCIDLEKHEDQGDADSMSNDINLKDIKPNNIENSINEVKPINC